MNTRNQFDDDADYDHYDDYTGYEYDQYGNYDDNRYGGGHYNNGHYGGEQYEDRAYVEITVTTGRVLGSRVDMGNPGWRIP